MRSMLKLVHFPVVSRFHWILQSAPALNDCPGPGAVGVTALCKMSRQNQIQMKLLRSIAVDRDIPARARPAQSRPMSERECILILLTV